MKPNELVDRRILLAGISIFEGIEGEDLDHLLGITTTRKIPESQVLFRKGDVGDQLYGVMRGRLRVSGEGLDRTEVIFGFLEAGEVFGEIALLDSSPRSATVEAVEPSELLCLHRNDFLPFLAQHPAVAVNLAGVLAARLRRLSSVLEDSLVLGLPARLAMNLVALAHASGGARRDGVRVDIQLPQSQLDELDGPDHESAAAQLDAWRDEGLMSLEDGAITIRNLEGLEALARFLIV